MRGVRIGEGSNPGLPKSRVSDEAVDSVPSSFELELTMLGSDDEPLVRPVDGRVGGSQRVLRHSACFIRFFRGVNLWD